MPVLVEASSVIIKVAAINRVFPGGAPAFAARVANQTYCTDGEVARIGVTTTQDLQALVDALARLGLASLRDGAAGDFVVVDQRVGLALACPWLELARLESADGAILSARLVGSKQTDLIVPTGWQFEDSISMRVSKEKRS